MDDSSSSCGRQASAMNSAMVWFHSFAEPECLVDDDEYEEVVSDVQGLSSRYGMVSWQLFDTRVEQRAELGYVRAVR